jgi:hypothetical protein
MAYSRWLPHAAKATRLSLQHGDPAPVRVRAVALTRVDNAATRSDGGRGSHRQAGHGREQLGTHSCACGRNSDPCTPQKVRQSMNAAGRRAVRLLVSTRAHFSAVGEGVGENVQGSVEGALMAEVLRTSEVLLDA